MNNELEVEKRRAYFFLVSATCVMRNSKRVSWKASLHLQAEEYGGDATSPRELQEIVDQERTRHFASSGAEDSTPALAPRVSGLCLRRPQASQGPAEQ